MAKKKKKNKKLSMRDSSYNKKYKGPSSSSSSKSSSSSSKSLSSSEKKKFETNLKAAETALKNSNGTSAQKKDLQKQIDSIRGSLNSGGREDEDEEDDGKGGKDDKGLYDPTSLKSSAEFKKLSSEDQEAVLAVFSTIASNDKAKGEQLAKAFEAASKINDVYFGQQLLMARDAIVRGYVAIDQEKEFAETQIKDRLIDLEQDFASRKAFMTAEEATVFKDIERSYKQNLDVLQTSMAATGMTSSSRRIEKEGILEEATGDLRASTSRKFEFEMQNEERNIDRTRRNTGQEIARLHELTTAGKLDFLRKHEALVGTDNLPDLGPGAPAALGGIYGSLPEEKLRNTISAAQSYVF